MKRIACISALCGGLSLAGGALAAGLDERGKVHDAGEGIGGEDLLKPFAVSYIALNKGGPGGHHGTSGMAQVVIHHDGVSALQQQLGNSSANIARSACH